MATRGPNPAHRPYLFGPLSTPIYIEIHRTMVIIWPSDIYLWTVFGPLCPARKNNWEPLTYNLVQGHITSDWESTIRLISTELVTWIYFFRLDHRLRSNIQESAPFSSQHGDPIGVIRFSRDQFNDTTLCIYHLHLLQFRHEDKHAWNAAQRTKIGNAFCLHWILRVWLAKTWIPPTGAPCLTTSLNWWYRKSVISSLNLWTEHSIAIKQDKMWSDYYTSSIY